jgi:hypothetical protein
MQREREKYGVPLERAHGGSVEGLHPRQRSWAQWMSAGTEANGSQCLHKSTQLPADTFQPARRRSSVRLEIEDFDGGVLLPSQLFPSPTHATNQSGGVQRLLLAVLENAFVCWFRSCHAHRIRDRRLFDETYEWFWSRERDYLCAFERICEYLGLDPDYIRRGLVSWQTAKSGEQPPVPWGKQILPGKSLPLAHNRDLNTDEPNDTIALHATQHTDRINNSDALLC